MNNFDLIKLKMPPIGHCSLSHGRHLVNRTRWLDGYRPLFIFTLPIFGKPCLMARPLL